MISIVKYVCPETGEENSSNVINSKINISYDLHEGTFSCAAGTIVAKTFVVVKCSCGKEHEFLLAAEHEILRG